MSLSWLTICAEGQTTDCIPQIQLAYLLGIVVAVVLLAIVAVRSRDFSTATIALIPVAIAINVAIGARSVRCGSRSTSIRSGPCSSVRWPGRGPGRSPASSPT